MGWIPALARRLRRLRQVSPSYDDRFPTIELFEWRPYGGATNFGDHLGKVVASRLINKAGHMPDEEVPQSRRLFTVGSVIHFAETDDVIWGSGVNGKLPRDQHKFKTLDVRAVRGPKTATFLRELGVAVPNIYGDPALLVPTLFSDRFRVKPRRPAVFIPNLHDLSIAKTDLPIVSPLRGWNHVIKMIVGSEMVVSSSLHGIVLAEAFGIPARYVRLSETEHPFKYDDYAQGTGRASLKPAKSINHALDMGGMPPIDFSPDELLKAFPLDLWRDD